MATCVGIPHEFGYHFCMRIVLNPRESFRYRGKRFINDGTAPMQVVVLNEREADNRIEVFREPYPPKGDRRDAQADRGTTH
jgi:hypothetical protein